MRLKIHRFNGATEVVQCGSEVAQNPVEVAQTVAQRLAQCGSDSGSERGSDRYKPLLAMRNAGIITPCRMVLNMVPIVAVVVAGGLTVYRYDVRYQAIAYLIAIASMILLDTFRAITMFLAPQTRILLSIDFLLVVPAVIYPDIRYIAVISVWSALTIVVIRLLNSRWLYCFNWIMSESVKKSIAKNPEGKSFLAWVHHGKGEARTLLSECGLKCDNGTLDSYGMYLYTLGFNDAYQKNTRVKKQVKKAQETIEDMIAYTDELEEEREDLASELDDLTAEHESQRQSNQEQIEVYKVSCRNLREEKARLLEEIAMLRKANEELTSSIPDTSEVATVMEAVADDRDSRILRDVQLNAELKARGLEYKGYRKIAEEHGVSKGYIDRLIRKMKDSEKVVQFPAEERKEVCL